MAHRHRQRPVGARAGRQPLVGELDVVGVVRRDRDDLLPPVARLGHPVRVGGAGDRQVGAPHDEVAGVPPVPGLGHVGLVAEHLRRGDRQVGVPVVEAEHRAADEVDEAGARGVRHHRHRRDGREPGDAVGTPGLDGVHVGGGDDLGGLLPARPDQTALAACGLVAPGPFGVADDVGPGQHRVTEAGPGLAVHLQQDTAHVRVAHPGGRVGVPGERRSPGAAARLVLGPVRAHGGVVGLLGLPRDDAVLDVHLPRAGAGAVHPVGRPHDLVVRPPVTVEGVAITASHLVHRPVVRRDLGPGEEPARGDQGPGQRVVQPGDLGPVGARHDGSSAMVWVMPGRGGAGWGAGRCRHGRGLPRSAPTPRCRAPRARRERPRPAP